MFHVPHWLWKVWEGGLFKNIIEKLSLKDYLDYDNYYSKHDRYNTLAKYVTRTMNGHKMWAYRFFLCEVLNLCVVVGTLFFTDWFLGGEFLTYGTSVSTRQYKGTQGNTREYKGIQGNTREYKGIQGNTRQYKGIQGNTNTNTP